MKITYIYFVLTAFLLIASARGDHWNYETNRIDNKYFKSACIFKNCSLVVGHDEMGTRGRMYISTNRSSWSEVDLPGTTKHINAICCNDSTAVAVGGDGLVLRSTDGENWFEQSTSVSDNLNDICYGNGFFYAVSGNGDLLYSSNSINWQSINLTSNALYAVFIKENEIIVGGANGFLAKGTISGEWIEADVDRPGAVLRGVARHDEKWIVVGMDQDEKSIILTSSNFVDWIETSAGSYSKLYDVCSNGKYALACGYQILLSSNGSEWREIEFNSYYRHHSIVAESGYFLLSGTYYFEAGSITYLKTPPLLEFGFSDQTCRVTVDSSNFNYTYNCEVSEDLTSWRSVGVATGSNQFVKFDVECTNLATFIRITEKNE